MLRAGPPLLPATRRQLVSGRAVACGIGVVCSSREGGAYCLTCGCFSHCMLMGSTRVVMTAHLLA